MTEREVNRSASPSSVPVSRGHRWRGRWLLAVAAVHTVFAAVVFAAPIGAMVRRGLYDTVNDDTLRGAVAWFVLFGAALAIAGLAVDQLERVGAPLRGTGVALLAMTALGIVLMPASGFWLALPVAVSMIFAPRALGRSAVAGAQVRAENAGS